MQHALAILTYVSRRDDRLEMRLSETLRTLAESKYPGTVFVVDDGSVHRSWKSLLDYPGKLYTVFKKENAGVSRGKNTCIRLLMEEGVDVGFLADDDVDFGKNWWDPYLEVHEYTNIQHLTWVKPGKPSEIVKLWNDGAACEVRKVHCLNGLLLTFTPKVIQSIGGFEVRNNFGWDHVNWTNRIVLKGLSPFPVDVVENGRVKINKYGQFSSVTPEERKAIGGQNYPKIEKIYRDLIE